jgi:tRNA(Ile)-lysidine synthase
MSRGPRDRSGRALAAARASGLVADGAPLLVLLSGGADSVCLLDVARRLGARVSALHVDHRLRDDSSADAEFCRTLCERLGVPLTVVALDPLRSAAGPGNLQAEAREARYALAERHADPPARPGAPPGDYATAHTASDQTETVLYRLAVSPGRRALLGMAPRRGRLVRPLLRASAEETRAHCRAEGLDWREDPTNADLDYARARVRHEILPALSSLNPAAARTIAETSLRLRDEADVLDAAVEEVRNTLGRSAVGLAELRSLPAALARLVLAAMAEDAAGGALALSRDHADAVLSLGRGGGTAVLDVGGGVRAVAEYGHLRFDPAPDAVAPHPVPLPVPGEARLGDWVVRAAPSESVPVPPTGPPDEALVLAAALGPIATARGWREGDRMRPWGLGGTKTLSNLFTDAKVPRGLRRELPVVEAGGVVVWVAGLAVAEHAAAVAPGPDVVTLSARRARRTEP